MWVQHMQKALNEMNLHLHHVLSDISGLSGLRILDGDSSRERLIELPSVLLTPDS